MGSCKKVYVLVENLQADVVTFRLFQDQLLLRRLNGQLEMRWSCTDLPGFSVEPTTPKSRRSPEATRIFQAYFSALHCDAFPLSRPDHTFKKQVFSFVYKNPLDTFL